MHIIYTGSNCQINQALKTYISHKFDKALKHSGHILHPHFTLIVDKLTHTVKVDLMMPRHEIHASESSDNMYKSIDNVIVKLIRLIDKHKIRYH